MEMRNSRVLERLRAGKPAFSMKFNTADPRVVEMAVMQGIYCVWTCLEHVANDWSTIERQIYAAKAHDADTIVRVSRGAYSDYVRPLELDATGIMVPHILSAQDARDVARMTRFQPIGRRPVDGGNADGRYCAIPQAEYNRQANERRMVIVQIEDPEPLRELDEIAAVPGIDMLFFGPGDFSHSINASGQLNHPEVQRARRMVAEACARHGKFAGTVGSPETAPALLELGYQFINLGSDVAALVPYAGRLASFMAAY